VSHLRLANRGLADSALQPGEHFDLTLDVPGVY
jgi:hypothetical protein